jgi:hypothetical protein
MKTIVRLKAWWLMLRYPKTVDLRVWDDEEHMVALAEAKLQGVLHLQPYDYASNSGPLYAGEVKHEDADYTIWMTIN